jgi:nitrate reductase gamma subunit
VEVPILVAIISVAGSLFGTIVGGFIVTGGTYFLARRREKHELRTACRLVDDELLEAVTTVKNAVKLSRWWRVDDVDKFSSKAWEQHKHILAQHLSLTAWHGLTIAVREVNHANLTASMHRAAVGRPEIFDERCAEELTRIGKNIDIGCESLLPYLS